MSCTERSILIIDDDTTVLRSCERIFAEEGFDVATTMSPRAGLEMVDEKVYDAILCDQKMPDLDGVDTVELLDRRTPESAIIMITGFPGAESATQAMRRGAVDYIAKPFDPEQIVDFRAFLHDYVFRMLDL